MAPISQEFLDSCPVEGGFRMRGLEMTRIEVFMGAAFAFTFLNIWFPLLRARRKWTGP